MIIINNPHNPTGKFYRNLILKPWNLLEKYPDRSSSDEVYEYITFEEKHISAHTRKNY
jgi:methionine aminotransferase